MYERFYHLRERPFALTPDPDYLYPSRVHREALSYLRYGIESQAGFVAITGAIGSGKTTLLQTLLRGLDSQITVARIMNTMLDPRELLESAMIDLGLDPSGRSKPAMLKQFGDFLVGERAAGHLVLLIIDEAQNLTLPALEEVRMLSNLETEKSKLVQIILVGQPDLRDKLDRPELEQLRQRITVSYHLDPLDANDTASYINHRLARASIGAPLEFPRSVTDRIHERSGGVPRLINVIADATLVFGYGEERFEIDDRLIAEVIADLDDTGVLGRRAVRPPAAAAAVDLSHAQGINGTAVPVASGPGVRPVLDAARHGLAITPDSRPLPPRPAVVVEPMHAVTSQPRLVAEQMRPVVSSPSPAAAARTEPLAVAPPTVMASPSMMSALGVAEAGKLADQPAVAAGWPSGRVSALEPELRGRAWQAPPVYGTRTPSLWQRLTQTWLGRDRVSEKSL